MSSGRAKASPRFVSSSVLVKREAVNPIVATAASSATSIPLSTKGCQEVQRTSLPSSPPTPPPPQPPPPPPPPLRQTPPPPHRLRSPLRRQRRLRKHRTNIPSPLLLSPPSLPSNRVRHPP